MNIFLLPISHKTRNGGADLYDSDPVFRNYTAHEMLYIKGKLQEIVNPAVSRITD
jgi:hypothetical protein